MNGKNGKDKKEIQNTENEDMIDMPFEDIDDGIVEAESADTDAEYASRLAKFEKFYLQLVIMCGAFFAVSVTVAVLWRVSVGILLAIIAALTYKLFLTDELKKSLGYFSRRVHDGLALRAARKCTDAVIYVPEKLLWLDVTQIDARAFGEYMGGVAEEIVLPATVVRIGEDAFVGCKALKTVRYLGSREQWEAVECSSDMSPYTVVFDNGEE